MIADAQDILYGRGEGSQDQSLSIQDIIADGTAKKKKSSKASAEAFKRPEGMHRELYNLLVNDKAPKAAPLAPSLTHSKLGGYANPKLYHWKRDDQVDQDYPFARFNKAVNTPSYTQSKSKLKDGDHMKEQYDNLLTSPNWTKEETDHLLDLANRFDLRWLIIHDRWEKERFRKRSVEDLKERFYDLWNILIKASTPAEEEPVLFKFDAEHERRRKEQLEKLWNRTEAEVEEEERLIAEVRKIEARQKERERKAMDLQKLITAADRAPPASPNAAGGAGSGGANSNASSSSALKKKAPKTSSSSVSEVVDPTAATSGLKFPDAKAPGTHIRASKMKLPQQIGQKKLKAVETVVAVLGLEPMPMGTAEIAAEFNGLREDIVLLSDLKSALGACEFELEAKRQHLISATGEKISIPQKFRVSAPDSPDSPGSGQRAYYFHLCPCK